jgi:hypothetical protein
MSLVTGFFSLYMNSCILLLSLSTNKRTHYKCAHIYEHLLVLRDCNHSQCMDRIIWSCILVSFLLLFAWHFCLQVLPHLSACMFSSLYFCLQLSIIIIIIIVVVVVVVVSFLTFNTAESYHFARLITKVKGSTCYHPRNFWLCCKYLRLQILQHLVSLVTWGHHAVCEEWLLLADIVTGKGYTTSTCPLLLLLLLLLLLVLTGLSIVLLDILAGVWFSAGTGLLLLNKFTWDWIICRGRAFNHLIGHISWGSIIYRAGL